MAFAWLKTRYLRDYPKTSSFLTKTTCFLGGLVRSFSADAVKFFFAATICEKNAQILNCFSKKKQLKNLCRLMRVPLHSKFEKL